MKKLAAGAAVDRALCPAGGRRRSPAARKAVDGARLLGFIVLLAFLPAMVCAFAERGWTARRLLFWNMVLKLCNIPFYIGVFFAGMMMSVFVIPLLPFLALFDYSVLLPSTMYGLSGLLQARREGKIRTKSRCSSTV